MMFDIFLQVTLILATVFMFLVMLDVPKQVMYKLRLRFSNSNKIQSKRHFVRGAQHLSEARSATSRTASNFAASACITESEKALALDPTDAASHILKALALSFIGEKSSAVDSLDAALAPYTARSLTDGERSEALRKRADLKLALDRSDSAMADLKEAAKLDPKNTMSFWMMGRCYESKGMREEARSAYEAALSVDPGFAAARKALDALVS